MKGVAEMGRSQPRIVMRRLAMLTAVVVVAMFCSGVPADAGSVAAYGPAVTRAAAPGTVWGSAAQVPGIATLNAGGYAWIDSVSCASAGNCSAGGSYTDASGNAQAFV